HRSQCIHAGIQGLPGETGAGMSGSTGTLQIKAISGHAGAAPGKGAQREEAEGVCKLVDVTTCIGCKACEVACVEWNAYPFRETTFNNTYQTMPDTEWNYYNLIRFNEHTFADGSFGFLMRKDQCMHCADPGCLRACPADGAIVQYTNGMVDFQQENCIGCQYCLTAARSTSPNSIPRPKKSSSVRSVRTASTWGWSLPVSKRARPGAFTSARRPT